MNPSDVLLIGVDGGATEAKTHVVSCEDLAKSSAFELRPESAARVYPNVADFAPVPLTEQLVQRDADAVELAATETELGRLWVQAAAEAIVELAQKCAERRLLVGIGMPGLKTPDGRGISVINNGPRIPDYLDALEKKLANAGIELASPIAALGSDADYCGLGEEYAAEGLFRDAENAYYVGCGTGVADALKLRGKLVPFDQAGSWILKSWQIPSALGQTFEKLVSARSLNQVYADLLASSTSRAHTADTTVPPGVPNVAAEPRTGRSGPRPRAAAATPSSVYPEVAAAAGDPLAVAWMDTAALVLAELISERLNTIKNGRPDAPHRGATYAKLNPDHEYRGVLLDRVIIGQRVGQIYGEPAFRTVFGEKLDAYLAAFIAGSDDARMCDAYLAGGAGPQSPAQPQNPERERAGEKKKGASPRSRKMGTRTSLRSEPIPFFTLNPGLVQASRLRAAPALGAAVAAARAFRRGDA